MILRNLLERTRALALFFIAAALLVAVQGSIQHPISHLGEAVQAAAQGADGDQESGDAHRCELCVAFSAMGGVADGSAMPVVDVGTTLRIGSGATGEVLPRAPPPFHSQAPPILS